MDKKIADRHSLCLIGMFILGETLVLAPYSGADSFNILALIIAVGVAAVFFSILSPILIRAFGNKDNGGALNVLFGSIVIIFSLYVALGCFKTTVSLAENVMTNNIPRILIVFVLSAGSVAAIYAPARAIYKVALLSSVLIALAVAVLFALSLPHFNVRNIVPYTFTIEKSILLQAVDYFVRVFLPTALAMVYICLTRDNVNAKTASEGVFLGGSLLVICVASAIMVFTAPVAAGMQFPYLNAVGVANAGELFTRVDGLAYPILIVTSLIKIIVCLKLVISLITNLGFKYKKTLSVACGALMMILAII